VESFGTSPHEPAPVFSADPIDRPSADGSSPRSDQVKYITWHWRGDLSLPVSYWVNGQLFGIGYSVGAFFFFDHPDPSITYALGLLIVIVVGLAMQVWQSVGIWRSADKYYPTWETTHLGMLSTDRCSFGLGPNDIGGG